MALSDPPLTVVSSLTEREIPDAEALVRNAGWNQTADDWRSFLALGTVLAIRTGAGRVIATAAMLPYGGRFGWISMVLVARDFQRRGIATQLMRRCIDDLKAAGLVPVLDATPAGRKVYRALGFTDTWGFQRLARPGDREIRAEASVPPAGLSVRPITDEAWPDICAYDAGVFGADRSSLLARLRGRAPKLERFAERDGEIVGLLLGRDGLIASQIGPLVAREDVAARALLLHALDVSAGPLFVDVPDAKTNLLACLSAHGFAPQRPFTRMVLGRNSAFDDGSGTYTVAGPEFG